MLMTYSGIAQQYNKLIRKNVYWDEAEYLGIAPCYTYVSRMEFIDGDTLIEGHYYRFANGYPFIGTPGPNGTLCPPYYVDTTAYKYAILREDTIERKVYIYDQFSLPHDQLLYDFSLLPGDTFNSLYGGVGYLVLDTIIDTVIFNGETRKMFCFDPNCIVHYLEGIGGWQGLTYPLTIGLGFGGILLCVNENLEDLWGFYCNYYFVGINNAQEPVISVFPNPTTNRINIKYEATYISASFTLLNSFGQILITEKISDRFTSLNISQLKSGIYYYIIESSNIIRTGKIIILNGT